MEIVKPTPPEEEEEEEEDWLEWMHGYVFWAVPNHVDDLGPCVVLCTVVLFTVMFVCTGALYWAGLSAAMVTVMMVVGVVWQPTRFPRPARRRLTYWSTGGAKSE